MEPCTSYFSSAVMQYHDQGDHSTVYLGSWFQRDESVMAEWRCGSWNGKPRAHTLSSRHKGNKLVVEPGLTFSKPTHNKARPPKPPRQHHKWDPSVQMSETMGTSHPNHYSHHAIKM